MSSPRVSGFSGPRVSICVKAILLRTKPVRVKCSRYPGAAVGAGDQFAVGAEIGGFRLVPMVVVPEDYFGIAVLEERRLGVGSYATLGNQVAVVVIGQLVFDAGAATRSRLAVGA